MVNTNIYIRKKEIKHISNYTKSQKIKIENKKNGNER